MEYDYLAHHGIKGQRWGIRRFQKKDGTLTSAGKKRYKDSDKEQLKKTQEDSKPKTKPVSQMTDDEIRAAVNRVKLEAEYRQYVEGPEPESLLRKALDFTSSTSKKVLLEPAVNAASKGMNSYLEKKVNEIITDKPKTIKQLKSMDVDKMSDNELKRLSDRLSNESRVEESRNKSNAKKSTMSDLRDKEFKDMTGMELDAFVSRLSQEVKGKSLREGKDSGMTEEKVKEIVEKLIKENEN